MEGRINNREKMAFECFGNSGCVNGGAYSLLDRFSEDIIPAELGPRHGAVIR